MRRIAGWLLGGVLPVVAAGPGAAVEGQVLQSQRFQEAVDSKGLARTNSGGLLGHLQFELGVVGGYERNPLVVRDPSRGTDPLQSGDDNPVVRYSPFRRRVTSLLQDRLSTEVSLAVGLFDWFEVFGTLPVTLFQQPGEGASRAMRGGQLVNQFALGDVRLGTKLRVLRQERHIVDLALVPQLTLPVGLGFHAVDFARPSPVPHAAWEAGPWASGFTSEGMPTLQPEVALSKDFRGFFLGGNLGLRLRRSYETRGLTIAPEALARAGVGFKARQLAGRVRWLRYVPVELGLEATGVAGLDHPYLAMAGMTPGATKTEWRFPLPFQPYQQSAEVDATAGLDLRWVHPYVGAAVGVLPGWGTPDWRVFTGLRVAPDFDFAAARRAEPRADRDRDGVPDGEDRCPAEAGPREHGGCPGPAAPRCASVGTARADEQAPACPLPDDDGDGVPNLCDRCPRQAAGTADGCPAAPPPAPAPKPQDPGRDGDGIPDAQDKCPDAAEDKDGLDDADGCPDPDNDHDGIADAADRCPLQAEVINGVDDDDGCPDEGKALARLGTGQKIELEGKVYFDTDKATIKPGSFNLLQQVAGVLRANPHISVVVEGHTDAVGGAGHNKELSQARAESVTVFLVEHGVAAPRLTARGFGQERPVATNETPQGREANRRVEFVISGRDAPAEP